MSRTCVVTIILSGLVVSALRFAVPGHPLSWPGTYEALTHVWVGSMLTLSWLSWRKPEGKTAAAALSVATLLETALFLAMTFGR